MVTIVVALILSATFLAVFWIDKAYDSRIKFQQYEEELNGEVLENAEEALNESKEEIEDLRRKLVALDEDRTTFEMKFFDANHALDAILGAATGAPYDSKVTHPALLAVVELRKKVNV